MDFSKIITLDKFLYAYLIFKAIDFGTGFAKAFLKEGFKSSKLRNGMGYIFLEVLLIIFAGVLDQLLGLDILLISTKLMFIFKECVSIVENAGACGVQLPNIIKDKIQELNPNRDKKDGE